MSECHENVKSILDQLDIDAVEFSVSADIKMCMFYLNLNGSKTMKLYFSADADW